MFLPLRLYLCFCLFAMNFKTLAITLFSFSKLRLTSVASSATEQKLLLMIAVVAVQLLLKLCFKIYGKQTKT